MKKDREFTFSWFMSRLGTGMNYLILGAIGILMLYPFWYIFMYSLSTYQEVLGRGLLLRPYGFTLENILAVLQTQNFLQSYRNTLFVVVVGTVLSVIITALLSYPLSRDIQGRRVFNFLIYFTMLFNGGMIPLYYVVRQTGLLDSLWALIIPALINPFNVFVMRSFFKDIPNELIESAWIDGATETRVFRSVIIPLSKPLMATMTLFYAVAYWNKFFDAVLYIRTAAKRPLQILLKELFATNMGDMAAEVIDTGGTSATGASIKMATVTLAILPIVMVYPFLQKYFEKGVMLGSVKG